MRKNWIVLAALVIASLLGACSRDPNVRKQKYLESGQRYMEKGSYREAAIQFTNALQADPRFVAAHFGLAQAYMKLEAWGAAHRQLERTIALDPDNLQAHLELGRITLAARDIENAEQHALAVLRRDRSHVEGHVLFGYIRLAQQNTNKALEEMRLAVELDPARWQSYVSLAAVQAGVGQLQAAEASFKQAISIAPQNTLGPHLSLARFYSSQRRWSEAEQECRTAIAAVPGDLRPRAQLARIFHAQKRPAEAEQVLRSAKQELENQPEAYRMLGDYYLSLGEIQKAVQEYASISTEHPKDAYSRKMYVQLLIMSGELDSATKLVDEIAKHNSKDPDVAVFRAEILIQRNQPQDAVPVLENAVKDDPTNAVTHYYLGLAHEATGNLGRAESEWREAARSRPNLIAAHDKLATVALKKRDPELLAHTGEELIELLPLAPRGYIFRAQAEISRRQLEKAEADLKTAIEVAPGLPDGYGALAQLRSAQGKFAEAENLFEQALQRAPGNVSALEGLYGLYVRHKQVPKGIARVQAQITRMPAVSGFHVLLGLLHQENGALKDAESSLAKAVELDQKNRQAYFFLTQVQSRRQPLDDAVATTDNWMQALPNDVRAYLMRGSIESVRGNPARAEEFYRKALQIQPDNAAAANNLAYLLLENGGNTDVALSLAQLARRSRPDQHDIADTLAWAYVHKRAYTSAIELLQEALKASPNTAIYEYHLGMAYQRAGQKSKAKTHLERALRIDPKLAEAKAIRKQLASM
jgi:tetratricopeptide (TPR) repeat protein